MFGLDLLATSQVTDRSGDFEDFVIGPGGEAQVFHRAFNQFSALGVWRRVIFDVSGAHLRVCLAGAQAKSFFLDVPAGADPVSNRLGRFGDFLI